MAMLTACGHLRNARVAEKCDGEHGTDKFVKIKIKDLIQVVKNGHIPVPLIQEVLFRVYTSCGNVEQDNFATTFLNLERGVTPDGKKCCKYKINVNIIYIFYCNYFKKFFIPKKIE